MTARLATQARIIASVQRDHDETEERAMKAWIAVDRLSLMPTDCLRRNRRALLEMQDKLDAMLAALREPISPVGEDEECF